MSALKLPIKTVLGEFAGSGFALVRMGEEDLSPIKPGDRDLVSSCADLLFRVSIMFNGPHMLNMATDELIWDVVYLINEREGAKNPALWPAKAIEYLACVWQYGQQKYDGGAATPVWQQQSPARHLESAWRHFIGHSTEGVDPESGLPHLAHLLFRLMAYRWVLVNEAGEKQA